VDGRAEEHAFPAKKQPNITRPLPFSFHSNHLGSMRNFLCSLREGLQSQHEREAQW
jgi:hypothetical protein